jgi:hypothetical protein
MATTVGNLVPTYLGLIYQLRRLKELLAFENSRHLNCAIAKNYWHLWLTFELCDCQELLAFVVDI